MDQTSTTSASQAVESLRSSFAGALLLPGEEGYESARRIWNGMIDKRPAVIARCTSADDVVAAVNFAREKGMVVAVRAGGHSFPGHSVCDAGLMIDLSPMKGITVDTENRTARVEPGVVWGEIDKATSEHGLAVTGGQISHTGIAGLTLGGGLGWLMRNYGLTCDNLLSAEMVLASGEKITASENENADLFWAIRGGGGNFGIVTSFEYRLHSVPMVYGGLIGFPLFEAPKVLARFREFAATAPNELTTTVSFLTTPDGHHAVGLAVCYSGDVAKAEEVIAPMRSFGNAVLQQVGPMPYPALQTMLDAVAEPGRRYYLKASFMNDLADDAIAILADHFSRVPSPTSVIILPHMGGRIGTVAPEATAFYHRGATFAFTALSGWDNPEDDAKNIAWARGVWDALGSHLASGVYVNELGEGEEDRVRSAYGNSYDRLVEAKRKYDPENLFCLNPNIKP